jgi:hypothetical protein
MGCGEKVRRCLTCIQELDPAEDIITMSKAEQKALADAKPWKDECV